MSRPGDKSRSFVIAKALANEAKNPHIVELAVAILFAVSGWNLATKGYFGTQIFAGYNIGAYDHTLDTAPPANFDVEAPSIALAKQNNAYSTSSAIATIRRHPVDYISHVLTTFGGLWTFPDISSAEGARIKIPTFAVPLKDGLFFSLMVLSFLIVIAVAIRPAASLLPIFAAVAALCVNANHLLVALVEEAITATGSAADNIEGDLARRRLAFSARVAGPGAVLGPFDSRFSAVSTRAGLTSSFPYSACTL